MALRLEEPDRPSEKTIVGGELVIRGSVMGRKKEGEGKGDAS
jgi:hypothetical protein